MKKIILSLAAAVSLYAQGDYIIVQQTALSSAAEVVTVQLPSGTTRTVGFNGAAVTCSVACNLTIERDGTAATTTAVTPTKINSNAPEATASAYRTSNVGTGTVLGKQPIGAGQTVVFDLSRKSMRASENVTFRTDSISGTVTISLLWREY